MAVSDRGTAKQNQMILKPRGASEEPDEPEETRGSPDEPDGTRWDQMGANGQKVVSYPRLRPPAGISNCEVNTLLLTNGVDNSQPNVMNGGRGV